MTQQVEEPRQKRVENWFDDEYVNDWVARQEGRSDQRTRQFRMLRAMVPFAPDDSFRYLNVGAGPGTLDEMILQRYPKAQATLQDGSTAMLAHARERLSPFEDRVTYTLADFSTPAWADSVQGPFDVVVSCIAIHNLRDSLRIRALYAEVYTLMAEGGLFVNLDYMRMTSPLLQPVANWIAADTEGGFIRGGGGSDLPGTPEEQVIWLREAGFAPADCFWRELRVGLVGGFRGSPRAPHPSRR